MEEETILKVWEVFSALSREDKIVIFGFIFTILTASFLLGKYMSRHEVSRIAAEKAGLQNKIERLNNELADKVEPLVTERTSNKSYGDMAASLYFADPVGKWITRTGRFYNSGHTLEMMSNGKIAVRFISPGQPEDHFEFTAIFNTENDNNELNELRELFMSLDTQPTSVSGTVDEKQNLVNARVKRAPKSE